jgi:hypothetical protein
MLETYPAQNAQVLAAQAKGDEAHRLACERQSKSPLLTLPREIRDKIWYEVTQGNVIHVSPNSTWGSFFRGKRRKTRAFSSHACRAEKGVGSSACPPGIEDHANCSTVSIRFLTLFDFQLQIYLLSSSCTTRSLTGIRLKLENIS